MGDHLKKRATGEQVIELGPQSLKHCLAFHKRCGRER